MRLLDKTVVSYERNAAGIAVSIDGIPITTCRPADSRNLRSGILLDARPTPLGWESDELGGYGFDLPDP